MCKICKDICNEIEEIFGHRVNPNELTKLIESSPLPKNKIKSKLKGGKR